MVSSLDTSYKGVFKMNISEIQWDLNFYNTGYQVYPSVTSGLDLHDNEGNWISTFSEPNELFHWVENR